MTPVGGNGIVLIGKTGAQGESAAGIPDPHENLAVPALAILGESIQKGNGLFGLAKRFKAIGGKSIQVSIVKQEIRALWADGLLRGLDKLLR